MKQRITILMLLFMVAAACASADIYKWVDDSGNVKFSDKKPPTQAVEQIDLKVNTYSAVKIPVLEPKVIMFSASWCGYCKKARNYFKNNNIKFTERDIEASSSAKREYDRINGRGVPVILIDKHKMSGFDPSSFQLMYQGVKSSSGK